METRVNVTLRDGTELGMFHVFVQTIEARRNGQQVNTVENLAVLDKLVEQERARVEQEERPADAPNPDDNGPPKRRGRPRKVETVAVEPEPIAAQPETVVVPEVSIDTVREHMTIFMRDSVKGGAPRLKAVFEDFGVASLSSLPADRRVEFIDRLKAIRSA